jgi:addiction module HigA family antidote
MANIIHPGEILREEFNIKDDYNLPAKAAEIEIDETTLRDLVNEKINITNDSAFALSQYFKTTVQFWLNLQMNFDKNKSNNLAPNNTSIQG